VDLLLCGSGIPTPSTALDSEVLKAFSLTATNEVFAQQAARHPLGYGSPVRRISYRTR
jgi:hypothetical protein